MPQDPFSPPVPVPAPPTALFHPALVMHELRRVLAAPVFARALSHQRLLRHLVEHTLAGETGRLKETLLGIEVFRRPAASFDPARDSIVRVELRRLRQRLARHYAGDGADAQLRFDLQPGQYAPRIVSRLAQSPTMASGPSEDASDLCERGEFFLRLGHEEGCRKALQRFEQALRVDPRCARGHFGVARAWQALVGMTFVEATPGIDLAAEAARRVLAIDTRHAAAMAMLASILHRYQLDWARAQPLFHHALEVAPGTAYLHHHHALSLMFVRRFDDAAAELRLARTLDPLNNSLRSHEAMLALYRREFDLAAKHLRAVIDMQPDTLAVSLLGYVHLQRGDPQAALETYRRVEQVFPQLSVGAVGVAQAQAMLGQVGPARQTLAALRQAFAGRHLPPYQLALVAVRLGDFDAALDGLAQAAAVRDSNFVSLPVDPGLDPLRRLPRFAALERRCGLTG